MNRQATTPEPGKIGDVGGVGNTRYWWPKAYRNKSYNLPELKANFLWPSIM